MFVAQKLALSTITNICDTLSITKENDSCASGCRNNKKHPTSKNISMQASSNVCKHFKYAVISATNFAVIDSVPHMLLIELQL